VIILGFRLAFADVFLVAHRLRTVIDYDRLIVLDRGEVRVLVDYAGSCSCVTIPGCGVRHTFESDPEGGWYFQDDVP
jgi:hypothetical protein